MDDVHQPAYWIGYRIVRSGVRLPVRCCAALFLLISLCPAEPVAAQYIRPLTPDASITGPSSPEHELGESLAGGGDVNGDGFDDLLLASPDKPDGGVVYLLLGPGPGPGTWEVDEIAAASFHGIDENDDAGRGLDLAGDLDGDGYDDVVIGAPEYSPSWEIDGAVFLFHGNPAGWAAQTSLAEADASWLSEDDTEDAGQAVSTGGDIDGDGLDDLVVAAPYDDEIASNSGEVFVILGRPGGWAGEDTLAAADASLRGGVEQERLGQTISTAGDVDGDGYDDILIGAAHFQGEEDINSNDFGKVYLVAGRASGWVHDMGIEAMAMASFVGVSRGENAGDSISSAGDVDGDGYDDILIGAPYGLDGYGNEEGRASLVLGRASGWSLDVSLTEADVRFPSGADDSRFGAAVAILGDVDGDGLDDLAVGAPDYPPTYYTEHGRVSMFLGRVSWTDPTTTSSSNGYLDGEDGDRVGSAIAGVGDLDGDGLADWVVSGPDRRLANSEQGIVHLFLGSACVDADGDGVDVCRGDCDDADPAVHSGADDDPCDNIDLDCDGVWDELGDLDADGYSVCAGDCNDADPSVNPSEDEACDDQDTDCDGELSVDEIDSDGDWYNGCEGDCDEQDSTIHPGAEDLCGDDIDGDCAGDLDNEWDLDADGFLPCEGDCDDADDTIFPGAPEICGDDIDSDCADDLFDEIDQDADGYPPCADDCDDYDDTVHPGAHETCDGVDEDCDGVVDEDCGESTDDDDDDSADDVPDEGPEIEPDGCACTQGDRTGPIGSARLAALLLLIFLGRRVRRSGTLPLLPLVLVTSLCGCTGTPCTPGEQQECTCDDDLPGLRTCAEDGSDFGDCECAQTDDDDSAPDCVEELAQSCNRYDTLYQLSLYEHPESWGHVIADFWSAPSPRTPYLLIQEGDCSFYDLDPVPFCDPPCEHPLVCGYGDECRPDSFALDAGSVTVTSPGYTGELTHMANDDYSAECDDCFSLGDPVNIAVAGSDDVPPFDLCVRAPAFVSATPADITATVGEPATATWIPHPDEFPDTLVRLRIYPSWHGRYAYAECVAFESAGALTIPASIVDALYQQRIEHDTSWEAQIFRARRSTVDLGDVCATFVVETYESYDFDLNW